MQDHRKAHVALGLFLIGVAVTICICVTSYLRPTINAQYYAGCFAGNVCPAGR